MYKLLFLSTKQKAFFKYLILFILICANLSLIFSQLSHQEDIEPVYFVDICSSKVVAFTFEILWEEDQLREVLDVLHRKEVNATFFFSGKWLEENPQSAKTILLKGNEIGNHTYSHSSLVKLSEGNIYNEINTFTKLTQENMEYHPQVFRPPYGEYNQLVLKQAAQQGYTTILWSINMKDGHYIDKGKLINSIPFKLHDGAIINFRVNTPHLPHILPEIIELVKKEGYRVLTVSELLSKDKN